MTKFEIRIHGRGGQGGQVAGHILAAAFAKEGMVRPEFKAERRSAPMKVGFRLAETKIFLRSQIYHPDCIILLDKSLLYNPAAQVLAGFKEDGVIIINHPNPSSITVLEGHKVGFSNADTVAQKYQLGPSSLPAVGTAMLGVFAKITGLISLESLVAAAEESDELPRKEYNIMAIKEMFESAQSCEIPARTQDEQLQLSATPPEDAICWQNLPQSVMSSTDTTGNKTGSWRRIRPEYSKPEDTIATCMAACPIHQNIREWLLALKSGNTKKAAKIMLRHNPLAASVSRVCPIFCEKGCRYLRRNFDEPVAINSSEKLIGDWLTKNGFWLKPPDIKSGKRIAVVGSGPAGLSCAFALRQKGYAVTVFEKECVMGGLLILGIPEDRLPKEIVFAETDLINALGVEFVRGTEINESNFKQLKTEYQAIFLAPGLSEGKKLDIPGKDLAHVMSGLEFLKKVNLGQIRNLTQKRVVVIGGGNTAIDSARTAQKLGAQAIVAYRRKEHEKMRAFGNEAEEAKKIGVQFNFGLTPQRITQTVDRLVAEFKKNNQAVMLFCDLLIMAVGQKKSDFFGDLLKEKTVEQLEKIGIFIGGDLLSGPKNVAHAIGTGNEAAEKIAAYLETKGYARKRRRIIRREAINLDYFEPDQQCFACGFCDLCENCKKFCPDMAIDKTENGMKINYDFCKGCQICFNECPRAVIVSKEEKNA